MIREHMQLTGASHIETCFSLMCWNIHKEMGKSKFDQNLKYLIATHDPDFILLQEAVLDRNTEIHMHGYNFAAAVNIDLRRRQYGVLSAARTPFLSTIGIRSFHRELHIATRKSMLITSHPFKDGTAMTAVNIHAINFVSASIFVKEIERLMETLSGISGPLIVTGDFNTWSRKRLDYLESFATAIGLETAGIENRHHIKHRFSKPLDHLYYRGLELLSAEAIDTGNVSDHNPIFARFRKEE